MATPPVAIADHLARQQKAAIQAAIATLGSGQEAMAFLSLPVVKEFFIDEAVAAYQAFLAPGADLLGAQARGIAVNRLYERLVKVVAQGRVAAEGLGQIADQGGTP